jgi:trigger factor
MKTELIDVSPTLKEIKIEIDADTVREVYNQVSQKYARGANVPGFRKGLAPVDVIRLRYKSEIQSEVLQELLSKRVTEAIQEHELRPLSEPELHLDDAENLKLNGTQPLSMHVHVEVMPEIPTPEYKNLEAIRRVRPLAEGELEGILEERRQQFSTLIPVEDRASEKGDTIIVDLEGTFPDEPDSQPIKADDLEIALGDELIEQSFTENLIGLREDEEKEFTVSYAEDFSSPALAGKTVNYKAKVKSVGKVELPELDDEWAQSLDEGFESMTDLRDKLQKDLETAAKSEADARVQNELIAKIIETHEFEVPKTLVENQAQNLLNNLAQDLSGRGIDLNKVEQDFVQMAYSQMRTQAERDIRGSLLLEKIAEQENIDITDADIDEEIGRMAEYYRTTPEQIRASLAQQGLEANIAGSLRTRRAIEAIYENAKITDGEWVNENQPQPAPEEEEDKAKGKSKKAKGETPEAESEESVEKPKKKAAKKEKKS